MIAVLIAAWFVLVGVAVLWFHGAELARHRTRILNDDRTHLGTLDDEDE